MEPMPSLYTGTSVINLMPSDIVVENNKTYLKASLLKNLASNFGYIQFYAPWCGHCRNYVNTYNDLAKLSHDKNKKLILVSSFNSTQPNSDTLLEKLGIEGFPTIKTFVIKSPTIKILGGGKNGYVEVKMQDYVKNRDMNSMIEYACSVGKMCIK